MFVRLALPVQSRTLKETFMSYPLETLMLASGDYITRPRGSLGTCGWHPVAWNLGCGPTADESRIDFCENNPGWLQAVIEETSA